VHLFPQFVEAIGKKLICPQYGEILFDKVHIVGFLDCKIDDTHTREQALLVTKRLLRGSPACVGVQSPLCHICTVHVVWYYWNNSIIILMIQKAVIA
jgi:hypothetical protein